MPRSRFAVILPAAGRSSRYGGTTRKPFLQLRGQPIWQRTLELFHDRDEVRQVILLLHRDDLSRFREQYQGLLLLRYDKVTLLPGGAERYDSVAAGLAGLHPDIQYVAIHDVVRALTPPSAISAVFKAAIEHQAAILGIPVADTLKQAEPPSDPAAMPAIRATVPRAGLYQAQTPQVFMRSLIEQAYAQRMKTPTTITDDAQLVEALGVSVRIVPGTPTNLKITTPQDTLLAELWLQSQGEAAKTEVTTKRLPADDET